jgi:hypothetical protein
MRYAFDESRAPLTSVLSPELGERKSKFSPAASWNRMSCARYRVGFLEAAEYAVAYALLLSLSSVSFARYTVSSSKAVDDAVADALLLSLSQRERIKVRDFLCFAPQEQTKSLAARYPVLPEFDNSKTARQEFLFRPGIGDASRPVSPSTDSYVRCHPAQLQVSRPDSRNREHRDRLDADAEIYSSQNFDSADCAKEFFPRPLLCFGDSERDSLAGEPSWKTKFAKSGLCFQQRFLPPHLNPLPRSGGEVGPCLPVRTSGFSVDARGGVGSGVHYDVSL